MKFYADECLGATAEYFMQQTPRTHKIMIYSIVTLIITTIIFASIVPFEESVQTSGLIRPAENISSVSNAVTGRIIEVNYKPGQKVQKGQILLSIDPVQLLSEKEALLVQIQDDKKHLDSLNQISKSIQAGYNVIDYKFEEARLRYDLWQNSLKRYENIRKNCLSLLDAEKSLPKSMTTESKLRELEANYNISVNDYKNCDLDFRHQIVTELQNRKNSLKVNQEKLRQTEDSLKYTKVPAPIDGYIQEVSALNKDDRVQSGQELFKIIPINSADEKNNTKVEFRVPASQSGKIECGMKVKMRFPSLPFYEFGGAEGKIITIDPDITFSNDGQAYFLVIAETDKQILKDKKGHEYPLKVGLQVDARIILVKRTLISFFLEKLNLWY